MKDTNISDPKGHADPDRALAAEEALQVLKLADELTETRLGELLRVELLRALVQWVVRVDGSALAVLLVEKAEVVDRELRSGLLVEGGDLV